MPYMIAASTAFQTLQFTVTSFDETPLVFITIQNKIHHVYSLQHWTSPYSYRLH